MASNSNPWSQFFWNDWENDPSLRLCSLAAQGLWMRMLCLAAKADPVGYVKVGDHPCTVQDLAKLVSESNETVAALLGELERASVYSLTRKGVIYNRRMISDAKKREINRQNGKKGGIASVEKQRGIFQSPKPPDERPPKPPDEPHKPEASNHKPEAKRSLKDIGDECLIALGGDPARFTGFYGPLTQLLAQCEPNELIGVATQIGGRPNFKLRGNPIALLVKAFSDEILRFRQHQTENPPPPTDGIDPRWRNRVARYVEDSARWSPNIWGPEPGESDCEVPPAVLAEFGLTNVDRRES